MTVAVTTPTSTPIENENDDAQRAAQTGDDNGGDDSEKNAQQNFIDAFETDEDELGEDALEGAPVAKPTAGTPAATPAPAQSDAASDAGELGPDGQPTQAQVPPAGSEGDPTSDAQAAQQPAQPQETAEQKAVREEQERLANAPPQTARTPQQVQEQYGAWRKQTEDALAKSHYALSQEQADELDINPAEFIAKAMSRVYLDAVTATLTQTMQFLPQMIQGIQTQEKASNANEDVFFGRWPKLKEHQATVLRVGQVYRQLNPQASMEQFINEVGAQTMVALRISPDEAAGVQPAPVGNGRAARNGVLAAPGGFKPATSTPGGALPVQQKNPFELLNEEFEEELDER